MLEKTPAEGKLTPLESYLVCTNAASSLPSIIPGARGLTQVLGRQDKNL